MTVRLLNCASIRPFFPRVEAATCCLLVETNRGLTLVDTGFGLADITAPTGTMRLFLALMRSPRDPEQTARHQIGRLGFSPQDVRDIFLTHLHLDHSGGLPDFPAASVHVFGPELEAALHPRGFLRWTYEEEHWAHGPRWVAHDKVQPGAWFGLDALERIEGLVPEIRIVPLAGHTPGHCGVAIHARGGWLFHCGDALPFGGLESNAPERISRLLIGRHTPRLRALAQEHGQEIRFLPAHVPHGQFAVWKRRVEN